VIPTLQTKILSVDLSHDKTQSFSYYSKLYLREKEHLKSYTQIVSKVEKLNDYFKDINSIRQIKRQHIKTWVQDRLEINTLKTVREYLKVFEVLFMLLLILSISK